MARPPAGMPVPPVPPANPPWAGDTDERSPTTLVLQYIRGKGLQPTNANVRAALEANAREPGTIPGLENTPVGTDPAVGQGGNVAGKLERGPGVKADVGPTPDAKQERPGAESASATKDTSAQPTDIDTSWLVPAILGGGAAGLGYGLGSRGSPIFGGRYNQPGAEFVGNGPMPPTGRTIDVPPPAITGDRYSLLLDMGGGTAVPEGGAIPNGPPGATPLSSAMDRAVAPSGPSPALTAPPGAPTVSGVNPYISDPASVIAASRALPPGVTPMDATRAAVGDLARDPVAGNVGVPQVNFPRRPSAITNRPVGAAAGDIARGILRYVR